MRLCCSSDFKDIGGEQLQRRVSFCQEDVVLCVMKSRLFTRFFFFRYSSHTNVSGVGISDPGLRTQDYAIETIR